MPFNGMLAAPNALVIDGGEATVKLAEAVLPVPPFVELTFPVVLVYWPEAAPVTVTLNWHWLLAAIVAPMREIPVGAVVVSVPPQTVAEAFATVSPVGSVSVNATPNNESTLAAGFVIVNVSEVVAFSAIVEGLNAFAMEGGASTVTLAVAVPPVPPSVEVTLPVVFVCCPAAMPGHVDRERAGSAGGNCSAAQADHIRCLSRGDRTAAAGTGEAVRSRDHQARRQRVTEADSGQRHCGVGVRNGEAE